ncbi:hypothetical protein CI109_104127 [Kwoniella shandongensis]|uniref:Uncharacterized protein n=1 Tax=Kwoniella shandongensis TaxID=1734106 RepID=A0A5M6C2F0_9TREE|nr:uncharacterized protein CI109_002960 [Kwoniella shandongensis]KAA5528800.1 hypothetical protein CI109_002960 [Kwoniella shandongensis]
MGLDFAETMVLTLADFLIVATGGQPRTDLMRVFKPEFLDEKGSVKVKSTLQIQTPDNGSLDHFFVAGDANNADPTKQAAWADLHGPVIAANIVSMINGQRPAKHYSSGTLLGGFAIGPKGGASQIYRGLTFGEWFMTWIKSKMSYTDEFQEFWKR